MVNEHAGALHPRQHRAERQLDLLVEFRHFRLRELARQHVIECRDRRRPREEVRRDRRLALLLLVGQADLAAAVLHEQPVDCIAPLRRVEQIARQRRVEAEALNGQILFQQGVHRLLDVVRHLPDVRRTEAAQERRIALSERIPGELPGRISVIHDRHGCKIGGKQQENPLFFRKLPQQRHGPRRVRHDLGCAFALIDLRRRGLRRMEMIARSKAREFELFEQRPQRVVVRLPHEAVLGAKSDRRFAADCCKIIGEIGVLAPGLELFAQRVPELPEVRVDAVQRAVLHEQLRRRLLTDARYARNIVRAVAHQTLEVDHMDGREAIFRLKEFRRIARGARLPALRNHKLDRHMLRHELQAVAVARDDHAVPARRGADFPRRAEDVVGLPALAFEDGNVHRAQDVLHQRHLLRQLLRHGMARCLIPFILQVPERRRLEIERHGQRIRLFLVPELFQNVQKSKNRVGIQPLARCQRPHAVERAVDDAVPVQNHQLHGKSSFIVIPFSVPQTRAAFN